MRFLIALAVLLAFTGGSPCLAQEEDSSPRRFRVLVEVQCDDEATKAQVTSFLTRELREIPDVSVELVDLAREVRDLREYQYHIRVLAMSPQMRGGIASDLRVVSVVITRPLPIYDLSALYDILATNGDKHGCPEFVRFVSRTAENMAGPGARGMLVDHLVFLNHGENLKSQCEQIVALFDTQHLEADWRKYDWLLREAALPPPDTEADR
ncbi:MAG: hypothetical protein KAY32_10545 [Candidatus Eisenbacteria sp.]|nr:hypothetical protein [Candidatus Eisenbacteria bacterium]